MEKRMLAICNLGTIAWGVGELLRWQEQTLMDRYECGNDKIIDIIWYYDPEHPAFRKVMISKENYYYYLSKLLPLAHVNPHLGSFMLMDNFDTVCKYVQDNSELYYVMPPLEIVAKPKNLLYRTIFNRMVNFHKQYGFIPHLSCKPAMLLWARHFLIVNRIRYPVAVHLRCSKIRSFCNSNFKAWFDFFNFCAGSHKKIKFVIIGTREEIQPEFRTLKNVIFSKDYGTTVEEDMALIQLSFIFMGCSSGPGMMVAYSDIPFLIFNFFPAGHEKKVLAGKQLPWAHSQQQLIYQRDTKEVIINRFRKLMKDIKLGSWKRKFGGMDIAKLRRRKG